MRVLRLVAVIALLTGPAYAQQLIQSFDNKTPQQKADEELKENIAREAARQKAPEADARPAVDAWGNVRGADAAKKSTASKNTASKSAKTATVKPQTKAGTDAN